MTEPKKKRVRFRAFRALEKTVHRLGRGDVLYRDIPSEAVGPVWSWGARSGKKPRIDVCERLLKGGGIDPRARG